MALPLSRREAIRRILVASALAASMDISAFGAEEIRGLGEDPDLLKKEIPWPRILTDREKLVLSALGDVIVPADEFGPAASATGATDFIDEWVSAPYEQQVKERELIRRGIVWIDDEAKKRFSTGFAECSPAQITEILEDVVKKGTEANKAGRDFFRVVRDRTMGAYYSTPGIGWKAIGYVGNVPSPEFPGPPKEVLERLGIS